MKTLVLASRNKDKIKELQHILKDLGIELKSALDFDNLDEVVEDADTLEGNALKKANYVHKMTGLPAVADDTGLEVEALDGAPGVYSARYAGEDVSYQDNLNKLLQDMEDVENGQRGARFRTVVAFVSNGTTSTFEGICPGQILKESRGEGGFGYDPVFQPEGHEQTFAEISSEEKNKISHRGKAIREFVEWLKKQN